LLSVILTTKSSVVSAFKVVFGRRQKPPWLSPKATPFGRLGVPQFWGRIGGDPKIKIHKNKVLYLWIFADHGVARQRNQRFVLKWV
jgi:hypothetical protein